MDFGKMGTPDPGYAFDFVRSILNLRQNVTPMDHMPTSTQNLDLIVRTPVSNSNIMPFEAIPGAPGAVPYGILGNFGTDLEERARYHGTSKKTGLRGPRGGGVQKKPKKPKETYHCAICDVINYTIEAQQNHLAGKKHKKNEKKVILFEDQAARW